MKYFVTVAGRAIEADLDGERITIDGKTMRVAIERVPGDDSSVAHVLRVDDSVYIVEVRRGRELGDGPGLGAAIGGGATRGRYELGLDGWRIAAEAVDERAKAIRDLTGARERTPGPAQVIAPMPGLVVRVNVHEGDRVVAGQGLVVMEAMKMENELKSASAGIVRRVLASPGDAVERGAVLLELEPSE